MIEPENLSDEMIEALVRWSLDRDAESIDPRAAFERLEAARPELSESTAGTLGRAETTRRRRLGVRPLAWGLSAAAAVLLILTTWLLRPGPALASAESLVREAKQVHRLPLDRCYLVEFKRDSALFDECSPMTSQVQVTRTWTRGDQFWVESANPELRRAWGREKSNRVWLAFGPHRAVRLEPDEVPRWLGLYYSLCGIQLEQLLGEVLRDFDLERETPAGDVRPATQVIRARLKPGRSHPRIRSAVLELDVETRVLRRMVIERTTKGQPFATVTYTLVETRTLDDGKFQLEGHLTPPYKVYTHDVEPERRRELLTRVVRPELRPMVPVARRKVEPHHTPQGDHPTRTTRMKPARALKGLLGSALWLGLGAAIVDAADAVPPEAGSVRERSAADRPVTPEQLAFFESKIRPVLVDLLLQVPLRLVREDQGRAPSRHEGRHPQGGRHRRSRRAGQPRGERPDSGHPIPG